MRTLKDAAKVGCKDLIADYDTLIGELEKYFEEQIETMERDSASTLFFNVFGRPPKCYEVYFNMRKSK